MKPKISFLIGSGFSIPEGLPSVSALNKRLSKINEDEILIHTDQTAFFLNGQKDSNRFLRRIERYFVQEFLEFYNSKILSSNEEFHYETFYDFYSNYLAKGENKTEIEEFYQEFLKKHTSQGSINPDCYNMVFDFNRTFNQLLASQLHNVKFFKDISYGNYPPYDDFICFLNDLIKKFDIKFHTLNHDLFFDWLGQHCDGLWQHYSDGFRFEGSPFYGHLNHVFNPGKANEVHKKYYVKLAYFDNKYDTILCVFKLHGSILNTIVYRPEPDQNKVRIKSDYAIGKFCMEIFNSEENKYELKNLIDQVQPDFLSGTTFKIRSYKRDDHYVNLFRHFETNLKESDLLIITGYGFKDSGINEYIENHYLKDGKPMLVIDPFKPMSELLERYSNIFIEKDITQVGFKEFQQSMESLIKRN
jgi:hypothetical protein